MPPTDFTISIKQDFVEVRLTPSARSPHAKLRGAICSSSMLIVMLCASLFLPGKHNGPGMCQYMSNASIDSGDFLIPLVSLIVVGGFIAWIGFRWSVAAWPSDETLQCDHGALTISRVPYFAFRNRTWKTRSYPLRDIEKFRFAVYASAKGSSIYGLRFYANGRQHKTLPGLEAPEAQNILTALQRLGVDVVLDDKLQKTADKALNGRDNPISLNL